MNPLILSLALASLLVVLAVMGSLWWAASRDGDVDENLAQGAPEDFTPAREAA